ncbi:MAG TPA: choice-of-anchor D domain-containing protein [Kiritimatiellia bacterium]|nr:choice-of-anchor D domain-containing protein [Kiritimatiellia bacterium]
MLGVLLLVAGTCGAPLARAGYTNDWEATSNKTAYGSGNLTVDGITWQLVEALATTGDSSDFKNGTRSARGRGYGVSEITMLGDKSGGVGYVTFQHRRYGTDAQVAWVTEYSTNSGSSWTAIGSTFTPGASVDVFSNNVNIAGNVRIRIRTDSSSGTANRRANFDDIILSDYASVTVPTVTTLAGTATNTTTATVGGNVTDDGGAAVTNRGVVYKTTAGVTIADNKTQSGSGTGSYTVDLTSLSVNTRYYFRAYAQNSEGTSLGSELEFWTWANVPSAPTVDNPTTSSLDVNVNVNGNSASTLFSIQATNSSLFVQTNGTLGASEHWRTDADWGTITVTGLSPSQQYGFRVRAQNGQGTLTAYSTVANGTTSAGSVPPTVTTAAGTATNTTTATVGGNVTADGGATVTNRGVVYKTTAGVAITDNKTQSGSGTGSYTVNLTSLSVNQQYYYRAYAQNSAGDGLGSELSFWTWANVPSAPTVNNPTTSSLDVNVNVNGNPAATIFSIQATNSSLFVQTNGTLGATEHWRTDAAWGTITVTGLDPGQQYGFRVRAQNGQGTLTAYSTVGNGTTLATTPTVTTAVASVTNQMTANSGGNVTADGGATVTNRGVVWALSPATPTVPGAQTTNGTGTGAFTSILTNLTPGATYNYRAFAQNSAGTAYGAQYELATPCFTGAVLGLVASVTNDTSFTAAWTAFAGAGGYTLDVSTNASFSVGGGGLTNVFRETMGSVGGTTTIAAHESADGFDNNDYTMSSGAAANPGDIRATSTSSGYTDPAGNAASGNANVFLTSTSGDYGFSIAGIDTTGYSDLLLSFGYRKESASANASFVVEWSTNNASAWNAITVSNMPAAGATAGWYMISNLAVSASAAGTTNLSLRWVKSGTTAMRLDDVLLQGSAGSPSFIPGYSNRVVAGTSQSVTGLTAGSTYYFRVLATNAYCTSDYSSTQSVTTTVSAPEIAVSGNGNNIADGSVAPAISNHTDFGSASVAGGTVTRTYTITNSGTANLTLGTVTTSGTHAADFIVTAQPSSPVTPGGSTTFQVQFDPSATGTRSATVSFTNNDADENPFNFAIQGTGTAPEIAVSGNGNDIADGDSTPSLTDHTDFGDVLVDGGTLTRTYTITNSGNENLTLGTVTTSGTHAADFIVTAQPSSPVAPGGSTTFQVQFNPSAVGTRTAEVSFTNNDADENPFNFTIQGTGTAPEIAVSGNGTDIADGDNTPSTLDGTDFGSVLVGNHVDQVFVITNSGTASLTVGNVTTSGTHAADFIVTAQPSSPVAAGGSTTFTLRFLPGASGVRSAAVSFTNGDSDEDPFNFSVQGNGVLAAPNIVLLGTNGATIAKDDVTPDVADGTDFGSANVIGGTVTRTFTITNNGTASLTISGITTSGTHAADFEVTTAPGGSVAAGATTTFVVTFDPADRGLREATFSIANNDGPNNPYTFAVQGTGLAPEIAVSGNGNNIADGSVTPALSNHTDFGSADIAGGTVTRTFTITNIGNASLTIGSVSTSGAHAADFIVTVQPAGTLAVSNSTTFQVQFDPFVAGTRSATLSFSNGDPDRDPFSFDIEGTGVVNPEIAVLGTNGALVADGDNTPSFADGTDFGATAVTGGQVDRTLFITNSGSGALTITGVTTSGAHAADFVVVSWPALVDAGARSNLVLRFDPTASGVRTAAVVIASDDADEASYDFAVRGTGQVPPTVTTTIASATNQTTATAGGNVTADGFATVTNRGVVWALSPATPTVPGAQTTNGTGTGSYSATLTNLIPGATYNYRAFAQNSAGTSYGAQTNLTTPCFSGVVTGLVVTVTNETSFTAAWSNFAGATGYALDVATVSNFSGAASTIGQQDFEASPASPVATYSASGGGIVTGDSASGDRPASSPFASSGTNAYSVNNGSATITFDAVDTSGSSDLTLSMRVASFSIASTGNGADAGDIVTVSISPDNGATYYSTLRILGNNNAYWSYAGGTGVATTDYDGDVTPVDFQPAGGGNRTTDGYSTVIISNLPAVAQLRVRVAMLNNASGERWTVDDVVLSGSAGGYVAGYSNRTVSGTSTTVTGLTDGVTYYLRVRATNEYCITDNSSTQSVTTTIGADVAAPSLSGFNIDAASFTDFQIRNGFSVTGLVFDAGGVSNATHTPYLFLKNNSNNTILASNKFDVAPANGTTVLSPLSETVPGAAYTNVTLGSYTGTVGAADLAGNVAVSNFIFSVIDDDSTPPTISSADFTYGGVGSRYFAITTNSTPATVTNRAGTFANVRYTLTDEELAQANARDLRFAFGVRDADSGIARGTAGTTNTVMSFSLENAVSGNFTNYRADLSSANYTNARTTNVWSFPLGFFTESIINNLMAASSNRVTITVPDDDNDRTNDQALLISETVGWVTAVDDDTVPPDLSNIRIGAVGGSGAAAPVWVETMGTVGGATAIAAYESANNFDNDAQTMSGSGGSGEGIYSTVNSSGYTNASGSANLRFGGYGQFLQIDGLDMSTNANVSMSFGISLGAGSANNDHIKAEYSTNGTDWVDLPFSVDATTSWQLVEPSGTIPSSAGLSIRLRRTSTGTAGWDFRIDDITLYSTAPSVTNLTDGQLFAGVALTGLVQDAYSGIYGTNHTGAFAPTVTVFNATGGIVYGARFAGGPANGGALTATPFSNLVSLATNDIAIGATYTSRVVVWDYDFDRTGDQLSSTQQVAFTVIDDDTNAPAVSGFSLGGATTNYDLSFSSIALTGTITDASGVQYGGASYYLVLGGSGVVQSNALFAGAGNAATGTITDAGLLCGQDYTIRVFAIDADLDRANDQLSTTQNVLVIRTIGVGGPADFPIASNLLVNGTAASPAVTLTDANIATGGWSLAMNLSHPVGVQTNATSPSFRVTNSVGEVLGSIPWSNGVLSGQTYFFTNSGLPAVSYAAVETGLHHVVWSALNAGSCVANVIDRGIIAGGTNSFTVVDDDSAPPVLSGFAAPGGATIDVSVALSGFTVTGLVQDAGSGVAFTSRPPYFLFLNTDGAVLASNAFSGHTEGAGLASAVALTNWFSGLTLTCGNSYTVRVVAADADNDRASDAAVGTNDVLVIVTSGSDGDAPTAADLFVNNTPAASATLTDQNIATGGWRVALSFTHISGDIVTNGVDAPSFAVRNADAVDVYGLLAWSNITKSGATYYATNHPMMSADTNLVTTGLYTLVWSARSEGLCFGLTNGSTLVSPGTNTFLVVDDDVTPPDLYGVNVGGGTGTGCGGSGGNCPDPTRTNLIAGDIAIFAMNTLTTGGIGTNVLFNSDSFAFVTLVDIPTGTEIKFTDNGWRSSTASFRANEGILTWRATNCVPAGTVVRWIATNTPVFNVGVLQSVAGSFAPNIQGEQILAYQGPNNAPNFIYAVNDRLDGIWDIDAVDSHSSALPPGLIDGYTAVAVGEFDNIIIDTNNLSISGGRDAVLFYIGGADNWIGSDSTPYNLALFNFTFPDLCAAGGVITDGDLLAGGWSITGLVQDVNSGLLVSNAAGVRYMVLNTNSGVVVSNYFTTTFASGSTLLHGLSNAIPGGDYFAIQLGSLTARLFAADADNDRPNDSAERMTNVAFTVVDDDTDPPQIGFFFVNGQTTITNAADLLSMVISGQVRDVTSGIGFTSAPPTYTVLDSLGFTVASGGFANTPGTEGAGLNWTSIWTAPINLAGIADCGVYTVRVTVADADNDRVGDRLQTNLNFIISVTTGTGEEPAASNLLVNTSPADVATLTDAELAAGGWDLAMSLHHPIGIRYDSPFEPSFEIRDPNAVTVIGQNWTNIETVGGTAYVTNYGLPGVAYANVFTGFYTVAWSARSQGACYGEVFDALFIGGTSNRLRVVDDDTTGPTAASNFVNTAVQWTNNPVVTYTWDTSSVHDVSGVFEFRIRTDGLAPTTMADGVSAGLTNTITLTNLNEGVLTNWLFAIDNDNDRANDRAMGAATTTVLYLDFTAPSQVTDFVASPGAIDDTSEIDLTWTPLADAGNPDLSPWDTYRVFFTQDSGDPTTNDVYFDASTYADLATNATATLTLQGLSMGSEYRLAVAGLDRAGNLGPISGVQTVTLGQIVITQAFANAQSQPVLNWFGNPAAFYDVIYADATGYAATINAQWKLAKTVLGTSFTDEGGLDEGTANVRVAPMDLPNKWMRFYRVAVANAWVPTAARQGGATTSVVVALKTTLSNGYNFVGTGMTPSDPSLAGVFGTNRLPAGTMLSDSTSISIYDPSPTGEALTNAWWLHQTDGWRYESGSASANTQALPYILAGYTVTIPSSATPTTNLLMVGLVPWTNPPVISIYSGYYHIVSLNLPRPTRLDETGFKDVLRWGAALLAADEIRLLQRGPGPFESPAARFFVNTTGQYRRATGGVSSVPANDYLIQPDDAIILHTPRSTNLLANWTMPLPFAPPVLQLTNPISAAPIVLAQAPLSITETSAVLRGKVTPNSLAASAKILWGTTTNYGSEVAVTNLPATNIAYDLSGQISGLTTGTLYYFRVWASNSAGISRFGTGQFITLGSCTNATPSAPGVAATDGTSTNHVQLSWSDVAYEDGYEIWRHTINVSGSASLLTTVGANATNYNDSSATPGQQYYYWLKAYNCAGDSGFGSGNGGYRQLATVAGLSASYNTYTNKVVIQWSDITGETSYGIWRHTSDASGSASPLGAAPADALAFTDTTATADTDYYYWVRGSNNTSGTVGAFPSGGALGRRSSIGVPVLSLPTYSNILTTVSSTGATLGATIDSNGGDTLTGRGTTWGTSPSPVGNSLDQGGTSIGTFSHARSNMPAGTLIYFRGWASNSVGIGYSGDGSFWTAPPRPMGLSFTNQTTNSFLAQWSAATGATNYLLDVSTSSLFSVHVSGYSNRELGSVVSHVVTNLQSGILHYWRLRAQNAGGIGPYSTTNEGVSLVIEPTVQSTSLVFTNIGVTNMTVSWTPGNGTHRMLVGRAGGGVNSMPVDGAMYTGSAHFGSGGQIGSGNYVLYSGLSTATSVNVHGLSTNTAYFFRVFERNGTDQQANYLTNNAAGNPGGASTL